MLKNILNINGVKKLDNKAQKSITGGRRCNNPWLYNELTIESCGLCGGNWITENGCEYCELPFNSNCY
ncbi:hypothetical protein ACFO3O_17965 [Dokdonia ponticola]|uniref:Uncharacterized protein n=1 Tax=Dokdonia ponticola TaxID=2041041 RepID=A0ABV9I0Y9_9FLAO